MSDRQAQSLEQKVDAGFAAVQKQLENHDKAFERMFQYMEGFRREVNERFEQSERDHADINGAIANLGGELRDYHAELLALAHKVDRLERWIQQVAQATGVQLEY